MHPLILFLLYPPPAVIFLDWSQYGAPGWTEVCPKVDLSKVVELLELQTIYPIGREERTLYR
jgi:hypothetical protein